MVPNPTAASLRDRTYEMKRSPATTWLRVEGAAALAASLVLYSFHGAGWLLFGLLILAPDLSMVGYLGGPRKGAMLYNLFHTYAAPLLLGAAGLLVSAALPVTLALIWSAHIGLDRMLGYGLKLPTAFQDTHLGRIGRRAPQEPSA